MLVETLEAKQKAADRLVDILNECSQEEIESINVTEDIATILYSGGGERKANIGCDSVTAMIVDICKEIIR